jgi:CO/xanthine dehydrogenase Mo-binding subunit
MSELTDLRIVGTSVPRVEARAKVTGRARFVTDLRVPGMVHAKLWRSPVPHARLLGVRAEAARRSPGVLAVVTAADLAGFDATYGPAFRDQPILARETIRYAGEPVAAVVAESEAAAEAAVRLIEVRYRERPAALTLEDALAPGAPLLHEALRPAGHFRDLADLRPVPGTNICHHYAHRRGDVARGFAQADLVVEDRFTLPAVYHYAMEPHAAIARAGPEGITVWTATQHPFPVRHELAEIFGLPLADIQVIVPPVGGAYGSKCYTKLEPLAVALARHVGRPVRLALGVEEAFRTIVRHAAACRYRTGVTRDGILVARECEVTLDTGAYADVGPRVAKKAGYLAAGPYRIPHLAVDARAVLTHNVPAGAYRGYGVPQVTWASESQIDMIAERLGLDPVDLRRRNLLRRGEEIVPGDRPMDADLPADLDRLAEAIARSSPKSAHSPMPARPSPQPSPRRGEGEVSQASPRGGEGEVSQASPGGGEGEGSQAFPSGGEGEVSQASPRGGEGEGSQAFPSGGEGEVSQASPGGGERELSQASPRGGEGEVLRPSAPGGRALSPTLAPNGGEGRVRGSTGFGVACAYKDGGGTHTVSTAVVRIHADGSVSVLAGTAEHGQGSATALAQIAAETLGVPLESVTVGVPDTNLTPYDHGTSASRSTTVMGLAVQEAGRDARAQLAALAAERFGVEPAAVAIRAGQVVPDGDLGRAEPIAEVIRAHFGLPGGEIVGTGTFRPGEWAGTLGGGTVFWEIGMGAAEVAVDAETGEIRLLRYLSLADVGRAINPRECAGQDEGGAMQGIGPALFEQIVTEHGAILNPNLVDYRVPTFADLPDEFDSILVENADGPGPFGAKGVGESGTFCVAAAVGNALAAATGLRVTDLPLTPERVWRALRERASSPQRAQRTQR